MNKIIKRTSYTVSGVLAAIAMIGSATSPAHAKSTWTSVAPSSTSHALVADVDPTATPAPAGDGEPVTVERSSWG